MSITDPYDPRILLELGNPIETTATVSAHTAAGLPLGALDVESFVLTLDEGWAPHARLEVTCVHEDPTRLDPRHGVRIRAELGYRYPGGPLDQHPILDLHLQSWDDANDGRINVLAEGDELRLMKWQRYNYSKTYPVGTTMVDVIFDQLVTSVNVTPVVTASFNARLTEPLTITSASVLWDVIKTLSDQAGVWTYATALGEWRIAPRPTTLGQPVLAVSTGASGITTRIERGMSLDDWANAVQLTYANGQSAFASIDYGPGGTLAVGLRVHPEKTTMPWPGSATAQAAAESILRLKFTRGDSSALTALAAWWVRPGDTITDPNLDRMIVSRVRFTYPESLMAITTRKAG